MPSVRIPTVLRRHTDGQARLDVDGTTVRQVFQAIVADHPELEDKLFDGDQVRGFINVYVADEDIRYLDGLDSTVGASDEIAIMPAVAGGAA
jgi:sulfur-carrier protein